MLSGEGAEFEEAEGAVFHFEGGGGALVEGLGGGEAVLFFGVDDGAETDAADGVEGAVGVGSVGEVAGCDDGHAGPSMRER